MMTNLFAFPNTIKQFVTRNAYRKEIILVLMFKLIAIYALWGLFFSHPIDHKLTNQDVAERYLTQ